jgi:hypothetical protein
VRLRLSCSVLCCGKEQERVRRSFISTQVRIPCEMAKNARIRIHVGLSTRFCCCFDLVHDRVLSTESVRHSLYAPRDLDLFSSCTYTTGTVRKRSRQYKHCQKLSYNASTAKDHLQHNSLKQHLSPASANIKDKNDSTHPGPSPESAAHHFRAAHQSNTSH